MRIWDLPPEVLCTKHLAGEHRELHGLWNILTQGKKGYLKHPETQRWIGKLKALYLRHEALVDEMTSRGWNHASPLDEDLAKGSSIQDVLVDSLEEQASWILTKGCDCRIGNIDG